MTAADVVPETERSTGPGAGRWPARLPVTVVWLLAFMAPTVVAVVLIPLRSRLDGTNVALVLVVVVVGVAATAHRLPGVVAAAVAGLGYDFFWTRPYYSFTINQPLEIQTAVLLVVVGAAVSELAVLGHRAQQRAARSEGYLVGAVEVVSTFTAGSTLDTTIASVERRLCEVLDLDRCRYLTQPVMADLARMRLDGSIMVDGVAIDADRRGLPTDRAVALPVRAGRTEVGYLELVAAGRWSRPSREQRQVAVLMASELGQVLHADMASS